MWIACAAPVSLGCHCCSHPPVLAQVHVLPLQLAWLECIGGLLFSMNSTLQLVDSLRPDELIWLHAYLTGRVHALMPATHRQMSGRPMDTGGRMLQR